MNQYRSSSSFSSVEVVSQCDDLVNEILLRLPLHSVFKFKCVSKTWNRLISDPIFCINYQSQRKNSPPPLLGFFRVTLTNDQSILKLSFLRNCKERKVTKLDYIENYLVIDSSPEGLILCNLETFQGFNYFVCNPIRNQWFALPTPNNGHGLSFVNLSCEECSKDGVVHFKVIAAFFEKEEPATYDRLHIETFSSRTGEWSESFLTSPSEFSLGKSYGGQSIDGIFYWKVGGHFIAYDPNMGENRLWLIRLPARCTKKEHQPFMNFILGQSPDGCVRFAIDDRDQFIVWDLKKKLSSYSLCHTIPSSEWMLKEVVGYKMLNIINYRATGGDPYIRQLKKYPSLNAFHPRNSKLVYLRRGSVIFCYDFETRRVERIQYHGKGTVMANDRLDPYFEPPWRPSLPRLR
ncbi:F-box protein At5g03970-like [Cornus florida]|uniref:F-box protein At5g03970-like n=1 Tax=Cornus florida TaxID=4283 RepID=UPI0028972098|nr:F-box protein At5g03970-like [Cornus florida]